MIITSFFFNSLVYKLHYGTRASSNFLCRPHKMWLTYLLFISAPPNSRYFCCQLCLYAYSFQLFLMCSLKAAFHLAWPGLLTGRPEMFCWYKKILPRKGDQYKSSSSFSYNVETLSELTGGINRPELQIFFSAGTYSIKTRNKK